MPMSVASVISNEAANKTLKNLHISSGAAARHASKLSSGTRVVTSRDDASAMAVGSRLNTETKSLFQASTNAGQASSMLQMADGAASRIQDLLTRMKVLAVTSGAGNISDTERALMDVEFQLAAAEINRIAEDTKYNTDHMLTYTSADDAVAGGTVNALNGGGADLLSQTGVLNVAARGFDNRLTSEGGDGNIQLQVTFTNDIAGNVYVDAASTATDSGVTIQFEQIMIDGDLTYDSDVDGLDEGLVTGNSILLSVDKSALDPNLSEFTKEYGQIQISLDDHFNVAGLGTGTAVNYTFTVQAHTSTGQHAFTDLDFRVGTGIDPSEDTVSIEFFGFTTDAFGLTDMDISSRSRADASSQAVSHALDALVDMRADIGGAMERLGNVVDALATTMDNMEHARSNLIDLDVATEITAFTNQQVLNQAGISTLAQANQMPQNLVRLFS